MYMSRRLAILAVVAAGGAAAFSTIDRNWSLIERADPPSVLYEVEPNPRAKLRAKPAEPMPPTSCRSVEPAPKASNNFSGPHRVHYETISMFANVSGFGATRMYYIQNHRGVHVSSQFIDRVELVSILTGCEPSVYVLDEMATPELAWQAKRRPLDEFERLSLDAVSGGENLMWTPEAPTRMFGAIRAQADCLKCHENNQEGDLLGAFTYYLTRPVDQLARKSGGTE